MAYNIHLNLESLQLLFETNKDVGICNQNTVQFQVQ